MDHNPSHHHTHHEPTHHTHQTLFAPTITPTYDQLMMKGFKILDFSPEWDYTSGGQKVIICFGPSFDNLLLEKYITVRFGNIDVPVKLI